MNREAKQTGVRAIIHLMTISIAFMYGCGQSYSPSTHPREPIESTSRQKLSEPSPGPSTAVIPDEPLDLTQTIKIALANNPGVAASDWDTEAADAEYDRASSERWPRLDAVADYTSYINQQRLRPPTPSGRMGPFSDNIFSGNLVLTMPIYTAGRISNQIEAAELLKEAANHTLARNTKELIFNVSSVFYSILAQHHIIDSVEFSQKALKSHLKRVKALIAGEKATEVDKLRVQVRLSDIKQQLIEQRNVLDIQKRTIENLMGIEDPNKPIQVQGGLSKPKGQKLEPVAPLVTQAYNHRSDYRSAQAGVQAQSRRIEITESKYWPNIFLKGSYGRNWDASDVDTSEDVGTIGAVLDIPLFRAGGIAADIRKQKAQYNSAKQRLRQLKLQIRLEVQTATKNVTSACERVEATEESIAQAKESLRIERLKYDSGKSSITDVLDAQAELLKSQKNYYKALADYYISQCQLQLARGQIQ